MRKINLTQITILILCLCVTGALAYWKPESQIQNRTTTLVQSLARIGDWQKTAVSPLDPIIVDELKLDDYVFQTYSQDSDSVDLYVGYYFSSMKVGAAHDPMVCFPGQGWHVTNSERDRLDFNDERNYQLNYASLLAEKEDKMELVFYWYQAGSESTAGTFMQKLMLLRSKFLRRSENNAFVRVSTSLIDGNMEAGRKRLHAFMQDFYPVFVKYVEAK